MNSHARESEDRVQRTREDIRWRVFRRALLCAVLAAGLFFLVRLMAAKSLLDAGRIFGGVLACALWADAFSALPARRPFPTLVRTTQSCAKWVVGRNSATVFAVLFLFLASTHAITALGIHLWQGFDLGFFVQATHNAFSPRALMWKNIDGNVSFFAHHFEPFLFVLAPLGRLAEAPFYLSLVQDAAMALAGTLLHREVRTAPALSGLSSGGKFTLLVLFAGIPFWNGLAYYEFHELSFAPLAVFLLLKSWQTKKPWWLIAAACTLLVLKETGVFTIAWFGLVLVVLGKPRSMRLAGAACVVIACGVYILYFRHILPSVVGSSESIFSPYFSHLGATALQVALSPILRPLAFFSAVFTSQNLVYVALLFMAVLPFAIGSRKLTLGAFAVILPFLPDFAITLLASHPNIKFYGHQYAGIVIVPVCAIALLGASHWTAWTPRRRRLVAGWIVATSFAFVLTNPVRVWKMFFLDPAGGWHSREFVQAIRAVPKEQALVVAEGTLLPFAAQRENLIFLHTNRFDARAVPPGTHFAFNGETVPAARALCSEILREWRSFILCRTKP